VKTFIFHLAFQNAFEKLSFADQAFTYRLSNALAAVEPHLKVFDEGINRVFSLRLHRLWRILESLSRVNFLTLVSPTIRKIWTRKRPSLLQAISQWQPVDRRSGVGSAGAQQCR
jgi:hypothetical protein